MHHPKVTAAIIPANEVTLEMNKSLCSDLYNLKTNVRPARRHSVFIISLLAFILCTAFIFTACAERELDSIAIVTCLEITADEDAWHVQAEIVRLYDTESEPGQNTEIITASGTSLTQCIDNLNEAEVLHIYLGHLRLIIFDKSFLDSASRSDIENIINFTLENYEIRFNTAIAVSAVNFGRAISAESASTGNRGIDLSNRIRSLNTRSELCDLINYAHDEESPVIMPVITVSEMNDKSIAIVNSDERYCLNISQ